MRAAYQLVAFARWRVVAPPRERVPAPPIDVAAPRARVPVLAAAVELAPVPGPPLPVPEPASVARPLRLGPVIGAAVVLRALELGAAGRLSLLALVIDAVVAPHAVVLRPYGPAHSNVPPLQGVAAALERRDAVVAAPPEVVADWRAAELS